MKKVVVIAGGNGFLGRYLTQFMQQAGWTVRVIARQQAGVADGAEYYAWDGQSIGAWTEALEGASALINMAGRTVNCRYSSKHKREIMDSRTQTTRLLGQAVHACEDGPVVWLNSSTATIYKDAYDNPQTEGEGEIGVGFSVGVAQAWEEAFFTAEAGEVRKVALRTSIVMAPVAETAFDVMVNLCKRYMGGKMGTGKQMLSWIHIDDFCRALLWFVENDSAEGCYNLAAPEPLSNAEFMGHLRAFAGVSWGLPANRWMLEIGAFFLRTETELILKSRWVVPDRLLREGFSFNYPTLELCLEDFSKKKC